MAQDKTIEEWTDDEVTKIFEYHVDDMHPLDAIKVRDKYTTPKQQRKFLIEEEKKFRNSFK